ncbi:MAG: hypothetical protein A2784_01250 [Candidatus Chisholmbacteria bacterium RIFCSPHIGHO2_01_FULL_48_12]|uniref:Bacterial Ig domain-containing protein n=1 Tax=Candidatus Chisholmbacteria bacterium RIFCSPHIGHO2_01_FULL_48_12 TaxID=1797589 RepID=A0A1G1VQR6_9BACT|nr:MAG: hypothetical protein A2784_01250 [Candidatus Chisholmbacteria bacterium RIFCSPHIGHO2_01_FULL_48_12]
MKKEVILAIVIGFSLGLVITFGIYTARQAISRHQTTNPSPSPQASPVTSSAHGLTITAPEPETVFTKTEATVSGMTTPNALVTLFTQEAEVIVYADTTGKFSTPVTLVGGANDITITAITPEGLTATTTLILIYSTATIEP